jgi:hypothetical protein
MYNVVTERLLVPTLFNRMNKSTIYISTRSNGQERKEDEMSKRKTYMNAYRADVFGQEYVRV